MSVDNVAPLERAVDALLRDGFAVVPHALSDDLVKLLAQRALELERANDLIDAGIGRAEARLYDASVRGDRICWIDPCSALACETALLAWFECLRGRVNRRALLGLFDFEAHYAIYPPGRGYTRHRDRFRDDDARVMSCVVYLNERWRDQDGGELRLHVEGRRETVDVQPHAGTLVIFLSDRFEHEVLAAARPRLSIAGWFRRRAA